MTSEGLTEGLKPLTALTSLTLVRQAVLSAITESAVIPAFPQRPVRLRALITSLIKPSVCVSSQVDVSGFRNASIDALAHAAPQLQSLALIKCPWLTNSCVQHFNGFRCLLAWPLSCGSIYACHVTNRSSIRRHVDAGTCRTCIWRTTTT